jgi:hypothetical protein
MPSRLFRSIVVFGTSVGAATTVGVTASAVISGCDLYEGSSGPHHDGRWGIIDAAILDAHCADAHCPDAWWSLIDAAPPIDGNWGTIADAPNPKDAR